MSSLERRLDRLEQGRGLVDCNLWCCASEADAQLLIGSMRDKPPPFVFITGQPNSDGRASWRVEGRTVSDLWKVIDRFDPAPLRVEPVSPEIDSRAGEHMTDEQLLGVIAQTGATLLMHRSGNFRLIEAGESL